MIQELVDKLDTFEIVRNKIAQILANESASQQQLAVDAGKDPNLWRLEVFEERSVPWDDDTYGPDDLVVNVWFDNATVSEGSSNTVECQTMRGTFNVDIVGFGESQGDGNGQLSGDEVAARNAQRGIRLVRNFLMASQYTYLELRNVVGERMPQDVQSFQPQQNNRAGVKVVGARLALAVRYLEFSPQYEGPLLSLVSTQVTRRSDGKVVAEVDINYDTP